MEGGRGQERLRGGEGSGAAARHRLVPNRDWSARALCVQLHVLCMDTMIEPCCCCCCRGCCCCCVCSPVGKETQCALAVGACLAHLRPEARGVQPVPVGAQQEAQQQERVQWIHTVSWWSLGCWHGRGNHRAVGVTQQSRQLAPQQLLTRTACGRSGTQGHVGSLPCPCWGRCSCCSCSAVDRGAARSRWRGHRDMHPLQVWAALQAAW
jgi:hypothetical protein